MPMSQAEADLAKRIAALSPEQRRLLELRRKRQEEASRPKALPRREGVNEFPLSFSQQRLWFLDRLQPGAPAYNLLQVLRLTGSLDPVAFDHALSLVVARHESLRTRFGERDGNPFQAVELPRPVAARRVDLRALPEEEREGEALRQAVEEGRAPFDLEAGGLLRVTLWMLGEERQLLSLTVHHIVADGWSFGVLLSDVVAFYATLVSGRPPVLAPLAMQYADFAVWQRDWLEGPGQEGHLAWWKAHLTGAPPLLELPLDHPRPALQGSRGLRLPFRLAAGIPEGLAALARQENLTVFMLLLAAFDVLLARHSGQGDVVVGTPVANRRLVETEGMIGFFANTLALRASLGDDPPFQELARRVREAVLGAFAHQDLPFERLVDALRLERHLSYSPLFQVLFNLQNARPPRIEIPGLVLEQMDTDPGASAFDLTFSLAEADGGIVGWVECNPDLFDGSTLERLAEHYQVLLRGIVADPSRRISELPLLTDSERRQLTDWNATVRPWPAGDLIHGLISAQAARNPGRVALAQGAAGLTYQELEERSNRLARRLRRLGVGPEARVGVCVQRTPEMVVALLGILKAGGAYVPLDPSHPAERLGLVIEDSAIPVLVSEEELLESLPAHGATVLCLDRDAEGIAAESGEPLAGSASEESLAYVIYTSGSTGKPKGVQLPHRAVVNFLRAMAERPGLSEDDVVPALTTLSFDIAGLEIYLPLMVGGRVEMLGREEASDGVKLARRLAESGATVVQATPATWRMLLDSGWEGLPGLRVLCGGEALPRDLAEALLARGAELWNVYGPTETAIWSSAGEMGSGTGPVLLGGPIANTRFHVVDRTLGLVPVGVAGELLIGGLGLARGYLGRPELTAEKFVPDPFASEAGTRLYRTGDLVRWRPSGELEFLGRIDHQVKVRGFRIELGEVESALLRHDAVHEAVVVARDDGSGARLVAYLSAEGEPPSPGELREYLDTLLPDYMLPSAFVALDAFPLTPSGKVDRRALPAPEQEAVREEGFVQPQGPVEQLLAGIWAEVLRADQIGAEDNFFDLGGHSLLATQVMSRLQAALGVELPLQRLFATPTVRGLARAAEEVRREKGAWALPPISPVPRDCDALPLSFAQERMWFLHQLDPSLTAYNLISVVRVHGAVDPVALVRYANILAQRHESLRTAFEPSLEGPRQIVRPLPSVPFFQVDLRQVAAEDREVEALRCARTLVDQPLDLATDPLFWVGLVQFDRDDYGLVLLMHHIIADAWSLGLMMSEMAALYMADQEGRPYSLPELPIQYADFSVWQRRALTDETLGGQLEYWKQQLAGAPPLLELPTDRPRPALLTSHGASHPFLIPEETFRQVRTVSRRLGMTPFMTLLAAFEALLWRYTGASDLLVGVPIANRTRAEIESVIGTFVNMMVLRVRMSGGGVRASELAEQVRDVALGGYANQDLPFEKLVDELRPERSLSYTPIFQVIFNFQNQPRTRLELPGLILDQVPVTGSQAQVDLVLTLGEFPDLESLPGIFEYNTDLFDAATIDRLAGHYMNLLAGLVADPGGRVAALPLLGESESLQVLAEWNDTAAERLPGRLIHDLFALSAAATPEALAVSSGAQGLSYRELDVRSNRLAHRLQRLGVGPEVRVGLCVERTPEMLVALLAVLKAGGAYVPLDASHPAERLAMILEDSGIAVLVTEEELLGSLPPVAAPALCLDRDRESIAAESGEAPLRTASDENLAYVIYTSGSTGRPKGVQLPHRAVVNFLLAMARRPGLTADDVVPAVTTLTFDIAGLEIYLPLAVGGRVEMVEREVAADGRRLAARLKACGATVLQATPATWRMLLDYGWEGDPGLKGLCGGEALPRELADSLLGKVGELWNVYGPTETAIWSAAGRVLPAGGPVLLGTPIENTRLAVLDPDFRPVPVGVPGELLLAGAGLARGYLGRADLTAEKFIPDPLGATPGERIYRTGDLVRWRPHGELEFLGRIDHQVKVRGFRIELGEIEAALLRHPQVGAAVVVVRGEGSEKLLAAYLVPEREEPPQNELREHLRGLLPDYMLPSVFVTLEAFPLTPSGKVDRKALPAPEGTREAASEKVYVDPSSDLERTIAAIWRDVLKIDRVGANDSFFDLGGHSMLASQVHIRLSEALGRELALVDLFQYPTVSSLATYLGGKADAAPRAGIERAAARRRTASRADDAVAVIGMAGRFPGAPSVEAFWRNLTEGVESISFFSDEELRAAGIPEVALADPSYIRARGVVEGADEFDAAFFGFNPREAGMIDPQQRLFLECAWEVFEDAGHDPATFPGDVGVFAGSGMNTYIFNFLARPEVSDAVDSFQLMISNDKDFLSTRVSYKLGLKGPSVAVQSACSTSLVAVHFACQSILGGECDAALAGGISLRLPQNTGYQYHEGAVFSPDGHCRAFDETSSGLVGSNGMGIVLLRRLSDALRDGDPIRAVIRGSAMNNDGAVRAGFTAPGVDGQSQVIAQALAVAGVEPGTIGYVEAHGTGTHLGDPIEIKGLTQAYGPDVPRGGCWIGSVKTNVGHLDTAAGITGFIKTALIVERGWIPPTLHFQRPNPKLRLEESPFRVVDQLTEWPSGDAPRRAGVSSLGIGGTNAHVILEQPPAAEPGSASRSWQLLLLSARTPAALEVAIDRFSAFLREPSETDFADAVYTLQAGRRSFGNRLALVCRDGEDALAALGGSDPRRLLWSEQEKSIEPPVTFLFSGLGEHYPGMARELYASEPTFRAELDLCCDLLVPHLGIDLRTLLFPETPETAATGTDLRAMLGRRQRTASELDRTLYAQPAVFAVEYALANLLMEWGIHPQSLIGYSLGEYMAACIAGVLSLEDALALVAKRARLIDGLPSGAMLAVPLPEEETRELLGAELSIASLNGPSATVASGPEAAIADLERRLEERGQPGRRLPTTHAFHSRMMEPIRDAFAAMVSGVRLSPPRIPYISNVTGTWITTEEATDPGYWVRHLCQAVRFADGLAELSQDPARVLVEVGPGQGLTALALQAPGELKAIPTVRSSWDVQSDTGFLLTALGKLWLTGVPVDWTGFYTHERRRRIPLPTYPFQRQSYWVKGPWELGQAPMALPALAKRPDPADWLSVPTWKRSVATLPAETVAGPVLVMGGGGLGESLLALLRLGGHDVQAVRPEDGFRPGSREDHAVLLQRLAAEGKLPRTILHLWSLEDDGSFEDAQEHGFRSLIALAQAWGEAGGGRPLELLVVTSGLFEIGYGEDLRPERATLLGPSRAIPWEYPGTSCRVVDLAPGFNEDAMAASLLRELGRPVAADHQVALRGAHRWVQVWEPVRLDGPAAEPPRVREDGVYLITGGMGGIGLELAAALAEGRRVRLALLARTVSGEGEAMARKLRRVRELEESGAEVMTVAADVTDRASLAAAIDRVRERFGPIQGVVHAAGLPGGGLLQLHTAAGIEAVLAPTIQGLRLLDELLAGEPLDFFVLTSGASALLGRPGQAHFSAAGAFLDAWAQGRSLVPGAPFTVTLDWDTWREVGMAADLSGLPEDVRLAHEQALATGIAPAEGRLVFRRVLERGAWPQVVVTTKDLAAVQAHMETLAREGAGQGGGAPRAAYARPDLRSGYVAPRNETEETVARVWQELLGLQQVGVDDNFFDLGGHSLLATQVMSRLQGSLGVHLPLDALFDAPTVAGLAATVEAHRGPAGAAGAGAAEVGGEGLTLPPVVRVPREGPIPLSFSQERMWFLQQLEPTSGAYNIAQAVRLRGDLNVPALARCFGELVRRHEALRTAFRVEAGQPVQVVLPPEPLPLPVVDLSALPADERNSESARLATDHQALPFDLALGPFLRTTLLRFGESDHAVLLTMHHIASDGWSFSVAVEELVALYPAFAAGEPSPLPELPLQYADFTFWQRRVIAGEVLEAQTAYWRGRLAGDPPPLRLPADHRRSEVQGFLTALEAREMPQGLVRALRTLSRQQSSSLFMTLVAAWSGLLTRVTGEEDVILGTPIANRNRGEVEKLIGFFLNTLMLRNNLTGNPELRELLARVRQTTLGAFAHQDVPLEMVLQSVYPERDLARTSPFQVMFLLQNLPPSQLEVPGLTFSVLEAEERLGHLGPATFEASLTLWESLDGEGLLATITYNGLLFDSATMSRLLMRYERILSAMVADPGRRVWELDLLDEAERIQLLAWGGAEPAVPSPSLVHQEIAARAAEAPDALAVLAGERRLTYGELDRWSNRLARRLRSLGVGPDRVVAVAAERSPELIVAFLAVLKAGAAYAPLDPSYPQERLLYVLEDSEASVLLTTSTVLAAAPALGEGRALPLLLDAEDLAGEDEKPLAVAVDAENLAYLIYTSGSTGRPKGVMVRHGGLAGYVASFREEHGFGPEDRVLQFASIGFDTSAEEIYPCLTSGAALVLRDDSMLVSTPDFLRACGELGITFLDLPTAFWHEMVARLAEEPAEMPSSLRLIVLGGERVLPERLATWHAQGHAGVRLMNTYGPTETTIVAARCELPPSLAVPGEVPIGRPVPGARAWVVDPYVEQAPAGVPGELCVGGSGLARGYLGRPDLTAERFVPDPWAAEPGARLYRTGDLVRWLPSGDLEFLGRVDEQVKIRGYRVELREIEATLGLHPEVGDAVVVAREDTPGDRRLAAYVVPRNAGSAPAAAELRGFLRERLPDYMVPATFMALEALPLTPSGKVNRRALPAPDRVRPEIGESWIAPRTSSEEMVAAVWAGVLGVERVGATDNFFDLGGHSLLLPQVLHRLRTAFQVEIPLRTLIDEPTVEGLALAMEEILLADIEQQLEAEEESILDA